MTLKEFLDSSPVNFLAVKTIQAELDKAGFSQLNLRDKWDVRPGGKYYVIQNGSAIFAVIAGTDTQPSAFHIV